MLLYTNVYSLMHFLLGLFVLKSTQTAKIITDIFKTWI